MLIYKRFEFAFRRWLDAVTGTSACSVSKLPTFNTHEEFPKGHPFDLLWRKACRPARLEELTPL